MSKQEVWIPSDRSDKVRLHGWLFLPSGGRGGDAKRLPLVIGAHGITCLVAHGLHDYGQAFAKVGYAALMFDYAGCGESEGLPRDIIDIDAQQRDYQAVIAWAKKQAQFDPEKIVLFGSSYSGGHSVVVASKDHSLAGVMVANPFSEGISSCIATLSIWTLPLLVVAHIDWLVGLLFGNRVPPIYIPITFSFDPKTGRSNVWRPGMLTPGDTAQGFYEMKQASAGQGGPGAGGADRPNRIAARGMVQVPTFSPRAAAVRVKCPLLVVIPRGRDYLCPTRDAVRMAKNAARGRVVEVGTARSGHFSFYPGVTNDNCSQEAMEAMEAFLKELSG